MEDHSFIFNGKTCLTIIRKNNVYYITFKFLKSLDNASVIVSLLSKHLNGIFYKFKEINEYNIQHIFNIKYVY